MFPRLGEHIRAGLRSDPDGLGRSHVVVKGIEDIDTSQLVAIFLEDSLDGQPTHFETEPGVLLNQIARCATERARVSAPRLCKLKREIEAADASVGRRIWLA